MADHRRRVPGAPSPYERTPPGPSPWEPNHQGYATPQAHQHGPASGAGYAPLPPKKPAASRWVLIGGAALIAVIFILNVVITGRGSDEPDSTAAPTPTPTEEPTLDLAEDWVLTPAEAADDDTVEEFNTRPDGAFTGPRVIGGADQWAILTESGDDAPPQIVGIDPATGEPTWRHDAPDGHCGDEIVDGALACMIGDGEWSALVVDVATGEAQVRKLPDVESVMVVHLTSEGLLVVGEVAPRAPHTILTLVGLDGQVRWQVDLADIPDAKHLFTDFVQTEVEGRSEGEQVMERPRWRDLDDGRVLLWSSPGVALIDPASGEISASECRRATAAGDHYFCATDEGVVRHALDGSVEWTLPDLDLASPPDTTPARPLAVADQTQLVGVDWEDGTEGQVQYRFTLRGGGFVAGTIPLASGGSPEHTVAWAANAMVGLDPETDQMLWTMDLTDERPISDVFAVDGILVTDSYPLLGVDPETGEQLWTGRTEHGFAIEPVGDALVSVGSDAIARIALPQ